MASRSVIMEALLGSPHVDRLIIELLEEPLEVILENLDRVCADFSDLSDLTESQVEDTLDTLEDAMAITKTIIYHCEPGGTKRWDDILEYLEDAYDALEEEVQYD